MTCAGTIAMIAQAAEPEGIDLIQIGLSVGIFAAVFLLIVSVFGQGGQVKLSPQRDAALATGHSDRITVFERPYTRRLMWLLLGLGHRLAVPRIKSWLRRTLVATGNPNYYTPEEYLALGMLTGVVLTVFLEVVHLALYESLSFVLIFLGLLGGLALTLFQLHDQAAKRLRAISKRIPYALDLVALAMGAGATFTEAVRTIVGERTEDPLNDELRAVLAEMELGTTRRQALLNLSHRVPLDSMRSIVASVIQAEELGTPLGDVLHDQATLMRLQRSARAENKAAVASVRILVPCLLLVFAVILAVFGPAIVRTIQKGLF